MLVQRVEVIPLEVVLQHRHRLSRRQTPKPEWHPHRSSSVDLYYKNDDLEDPLLTDARVRLMGLVDDARLLAIEQLARRISGVLQPFFDGLELQLVDFKLELGLNKAGELLRSMRSAPTPAASGSASAMPTIESWTRTASARISVE